MHVTRIVPNFTNLLVELRCIGANAIADVIRHNPNLSILDLSNNNVRQEGISVIRDAVAFNKRVTKMVILPQALYPVKSDTKLSYGETLDKTLDDIEAICAQHKLDATFDEYDHILSGVRYLTLQFCHI